MARIKSYPLDADIKGSDKIIGTDADTSNTKNFSLSGIKNFINFKEDVITVTASELANIGTGKTIVAAPVNHIVDVIGVLFKSSGNEASGLLANRLEFSGNLVLTHRFAPTPGVTETRLALPAATANSTGDNYYVAQPDYGGIANTAPSLGGQGDIIVLRSSANPTSTGTPVMQLKVYIAYRLIDVS
tara:strand:+ start:503 stop:1063 length:561 start_codon:yes stop_codon:yes gene_type:complete